ncbi:MAG TPA: hypothetical protein VEZ12_02225, partial [Herpetosiphonaceae bacterium]|nr:hypothetical protein [Herpetosiphonaceae bacterium]
GAAHSKVRTERVVVMSGDNSTLPVAPTLSGTPSKQCEDAMHTTIQEPRFPTQMRGVSDGSVAGTHFSTTTGEALVLAGITVQQEGLSIVRIRFAAHYAIGSVVLGADDTLSVNVEHAG